MSGDGVPRPGAASGVQWTGALHLCQGLPDARSTEADQAQDQSGAAQLSSLLHGNGTFVFLLLLLVQFL